MAEDKVFVSFTCQRCSQSLKLDDSLNSFSEHIAAELNLPLHSITDIDLESQATSFDHYVPPCTLSDSRNCASGFMVVTDECEVELLSQQFKTRSTLFDHLSGSSDIDHPLCDECTDYLIEILEQQLNITKKDYDDYCEYYKVLQADKNEPKLSELEKELNNLSEEETRLLEELDALKKDEDVTLKAIANQEEIARHLEEEERRYWREYVSRKSEWIAAEDEARSVKCQLEAAETQLQKLQTTNAFNATFHIWHQNHFGTINNFRLGTLPSQPIRWEEINLAWGQTMLLFCALARKLNLTFERYRPVPYGNHSYIEVIGENRKLPLYGYGGNKYVFDTKFDVAMMAFLDLVQQFTQKLEELGKHDKDFKFPYRISNGKLKDLDGSQYSLRATIISEEQWTKGLKLMLTDLKWGLAFAASQFDKNGQDIPFTTQV